MHSSIMTSSKDSQQSSRPLNQHRLSISSISSLPKSNNRIHSHPGTFGACHTPRHRVTRRKSVSTNSIIVAAAAKDASDTSQGIPINGRRSITSRSNSSKTSTMGSLPTIPMSLPTQKIRLTFSGKADRGEESAIDDDHMDDIDDEDGKNTSDLAPQARRASEGQHLMNDGKKPSSNDLKCDKCGKGYKHSSCLSKHLWEHTPEWSYTSKLLISKHQQVQLLEAASVLLTMTQDVSTSLQLGSDYQSDHDSTSASSDQHDHVSSAGTTPPQADVFSTYSKRPYARDEYKILNDEKRLSNSYQSTSSIDFFGRENDANACIFGGQVSIDRRPDSSQSNSKKPINKNSEDDSLASAVQLLSCSFGVAGAPKALGEPFSMHTPIKNITARYLDQCNYSSPEFTARYHPRQQESYTRSQVNYSKDIKMESAESVTDDEEFEHRSPSRSDEDDEGIFGRMEE